MFHQGQRGVGGVEHGATGDSGGAGEVGDQADVLLQQRSGEAGKAVQTAGITAKSVEREASSRCRGR